MALLPNFFFALILFQGPAQNSNGKYLFYRLTFGKSIST